MSTLENVLSDFCSWEMFSIISSITDSCKIIDNKISNDFSELQGSSESFNKSGDLKTNLDIYCNDLILANLELLDHVTAVISEESDEIIRKNQGERKYLVAFDPLDGSSNISCEGELGTIFGIYRDTGELPSGNNIRCSGYILYTYRTMLILTFGEEIYRFYLDNNTKEFLLTTSNLSLPVEPKRILSVNVGNYERWGKSDKELYHHFIKNNYKIRYSGCMVMDVHRILMEGGIFFYPKDSKNPQGKLRLIYECFPMSFIVEAAGGISSTGEGRLLSIEPEELHQKIPIYIGCKRDLFEVKQKRFGMIPDRESIVCENFSASGEDELFVRSGEEIRIVRTMNDNNWVVASKKDGEKGLLPTKCINL